MPRAPSNGSSASSRSNLQPNILALLSAELGDLGGLTGGQLLQRLQEAAANPNDENAGATTLSAEELDEVADDPEADLDDDEEAPVTRRRKRARQELEDTEDEEEVEAPRPGRRGRPLNPVFSTSSSTSVRSNLPRRKTPATSQGTRQRRRVASQVTASPSTPSPRHSSPTIAGRPSTPPRPTTPQATASVQAFTPFRIEHNGTKARIQDSSPTTQALLEGANANFRVYLATRNPFPDLATQSTEIKAAFKAACDDSDIRVTRRLTRAQHDVAYNKYILDVVKQRTSQLRGDVKKVADNLVAFHYGFTTLSSSAIMDSVRDLLARAAFTFAVPAKREGLYNHPIIAAVIAGCWFKHASSDGRGEYSSQFNPVPFPVIALAATAVECALESWSTGICLKFSNHFTHGKYSKAYDRHINNLELWRSSCPAACAARRAALWDEVWHIAGAAQPAAVVDIDFDENDFVAES